MSSKDRSLQEIVNALVESDSDVPSLRAGRLVVDVVGYRAQFNGRQLQLSTSELEILAILGASRRICSRKELSDAIGLHGVRTVDMILSKIRQKVGRDFIRNVHSLGWIIDTTILKD